MALFQPPPPPRPEIRPPSAMERLAKMAAYPAPPTCPLDGHELDIHFHGGVECPMCGAEYELGRGNELFPLKEHVEESAKTWPDTIPSEWRMAQADVKDLYHATPISRVDKIMREGLAPQVSDNTRRWWPNAQPFVHAVDHPDELYDRFGDFLHEHANEPYAILRVPPKYFNQFTEDEDGSGRERGTWFSTQTIPPGEIQHTGVEVPDDWRETWTFEPGSPYHKLAMADRTGNPQVDALIEQFLQTPQGEWTTNDQPIEALRDPELAHGMCQMVTEQFVEFAKSKGFKAYVTNTDMAEMGYKPQIEPFGEVGFDENDEMQHGFYPEHTIATIVMDDPAYPYGREFYIDFTASQYGYTDHPKVTSATDWKAKYDYRKRETVKHSCLTCSAFKPGPNAEGNGRGKCLMFDAAVEGDMTCTEWSDTWREKTSADAGYGEAPGGYSQIWDYPFLFHQPTGELTWGTGNGNHEPLKEQMRARGENVRPDLTHGRWHPDDDTVKFYDPKYDDMRPEERQKYDDMIRRNCPYRPAGTPQEPSSAPQTVEDDWAPQINLGGL